MKTTLFVSASFAAIASASPATAQDAQSAPVPQSVPAANAPNGAAISGVQPEDQGIPDIIVTAQRVTESAQKAPIAISVVKPEELVRNAVTRPEELSRVVPALAVTSGGGTIVNYFIRGVGNLSNNSYSDPAVAFNYDGVYIGRPTSTSGTLFDLQRVEVLKGPQGTLYGRNATGGAINVIPNHPKPGVTSAELTASYGNYNAINAQGAINLAVGPSAAFRLAATVNDHDAYMDDGTFNQKEWGVRGQFYAEATPDLNVRLAADYAHQGGSGSFSTYIGVTRPNFGPTGFTGYSYTPTNFGPSMGILDPASQALLAAQPITNAGRAGAMIAGKPYNNNDFYGVNAELNWKIGPGTLTVVPAYREAKLDNLFTTGMNGGYTNEKDRQFSLEARYAASLGPVDLLAGAFYYDERVNTFSYFSQFWLDPFQTYNTVTKSYAGFGKLTWHVTDKFSLTAAGRFTHDRKTFDGVSDTYLLFCGNPALQNSCPTLPLMPLAGSAAQLRAYYAAAGVPVTTVPLFVLPPAFGGSQTAPFVLNSPITINNAVIDKGKFTYRLAAEYQLSNSSMVYASYETGYHAGGFAFARGLETYRPETISAWTVGTKNRFADNRLQFNVEGFLWKYCDQQLSGFGYDLGTPPAAVFLTRNVGRSTIYGFDMDTEFLATPTTLLSAGVQYLHVREDQFAYLSPNQGLPPVTSCATTPTTTVINGSTVAVYAVDCSGKGGINTPAWTLNANAQQTIPLDAYKVVLQAGARYRSSAAQDFNYSSFYTAKAGANINLSATFGPRDDRWSVTAFANNVNNFRRVFLAGPTIASGLVVGSYEAPRTYGLRVGAKF